MDNRSLPAYTVREVAHYLSMPPTTVRYWSVGRGPYEPLISVPVRSPVLLSFFNLVELHVLAAIRRKYVVKMPKVRAAMRYLEEMSETPHGRRHPLISRELDTDGIDLFVQQYGYPVSISESGQLAIREMVKSALERIARDEHGLPSVLYPFTRSTDSEDPRRIVIDPKKSAGRPVIAGTGIAIQMIAERFKAGESIESLAYDYRRESLEIEEAIRCGYAAA